MSEKPKWTATRFECELGYVEMHPVRKDWDAFVRRDWLPGQECEYLDEFPTAEEAQAAVEAAKS